MTNHLVHLIVISALVSHCYCQDRGREDYRVTISPILDVLRSGHLSGSLEYWGRCGNEREYVGRDLPRLTTPSSNSESPLQMLHEMFANDEKMQVTQEPDGTIRMVEKDVPRDLLDVKIAHISFDDGLKKWGAMFSARNVQRFIVAAPEVTTFMKNHNIGQTGMLINEVVVPAPHISGELNNVTLSDALDYMLKTFPGLWVYKNCPGNAKNKRVVVFAYYPAEQRPADHAMQ
jgi:hypothetical protein